MALKISVNENYHLPRPIASSFVKVRAELSRATADQISFHVAHRELECTFVIVLLVESANRAVPRLKKI